MAEEFEKNCPGSRNTLNPPYCMSENQLHHMDTAWKFCLQLLKLIRRHTVLESEFYCIY